MQQLVPRCFLASLVVMTLAVVSSTGDLTLVASSPAGLNNAAQNVSELARVRPNRIRVVVSRDKIALDNETPGVDPTKVWALPGGTVLYVVENTDSLRHTVSIPLNGFVPKFKDATADPLEAKQRDTIDIEPGQRGALVLAVKRLAHFGFNNPPWNKDRSMSMTYKYTVHTLPAGGKKITLDPDLEIDQP